MNSLLVIFHNHDEGGEYLTTWIWFYFDENNYAPSRRHTDVDGFPVCNGMCEADFDIRYNPEDLKTYQSLKDNAIQAGWKIEENGKGF